MLVTTITSSTSALEMQMGGLLIHIAEAQDLTAFTSVPILLYGLRQGQREEWCRYLSRVRYFTTGVSTTILKAQGPNRGNILRRKGTASRNQRSNKQLNQYSLLNLLTERAGNKSHYRALSHDGAPTACPLALVHLMISHVLPFLAIHETTTIRYYEYLIMRGLIMESRGMIIVSG